MARTLSPDSTQTKIALIIKIITAAAAAIALYSQDLIIVFTDALHDESASHILLIPLIFAYLIYRKRKMLRAVIPAQDSSSLGRRYAPTLAGILLCATAVILYWHGSYTFTPLEYHILTLPVFTAGLLLILFNYQTLRQLAFPTFFLAFLTPPPIEIIYGLGSTLSVISSEASTAIVNLFGIPATLSGEYGIPMITITRPDNATINFAVDIACSGIYSLIGFLIFAAFIAFIARDKLWKKALTFIIGFPIIYLLNIIRITIILGIGYHIGEQLALTLFHLLGGWVLIFLGTLLLLAISEGIIKARIFGRKPTQCSFCKLETLLQNETYCKTCGRIIKYPQLRMKKSDITKIASIAAATLLLLSIQAPVFAVTQGPAQILIQTPDGEQGNTEIFPEIPGYSIQFIYRDTDFEQTAKQDLSLLYAYTSQEDKEPVWVALEIAPTRSSLHRWETCLVTWPQTHGYQPKVTQLTLEDTQILDNPPIIARYFGFQYLKDNLTQLVLYWYETSTFTINNVTQQRNVKLSLLAFPESPEEIPTTKPQLLQIAEAIAGYWQPIKTWALISMVLSQQGLTLASATTTTLIALAIILFYEHEKTKTANRNLYNKLSKPNQQLIDIIKETQKTTLPTLNNIQETYQKAALGLVTPQELERKIISLEGIKIAKSTIANNNDEPTQAWIVAIRSTPRKH